MSTLPSQDPRYLQFIMRKYDEGNLPKGNLQDGNISDPLTQALESAISNENVSGFQNIVSAYTSLSLRGDTLNFYDGAVTLWPSWEGDTSVFETIKSNEMLSAVLKSVDVLLPEDRAEEVFEILKTGLYENKHGLDLKDAAFKISAGEELDIKILPTTSLPRPPMPLPPLSMP